MSRHTELDTLVREAMTLGRPDRILCDGSAAGTTRAGIFAQAGTEIRSLGSRAARLGARLFTHAWPHQASHFAMPPWASQLTYGQR
ncbi:MAG: hypothetical protein ACLQHS_13740 [Candidatus Limnocylindrales bacterium]